MEQLLTLHAAIGKTGPCGPVWRGADRTGRLRLAPVPVEPLHTAFRRMVRDLEFDLAEMPVVTFAQAMLENRPLVLLPVPSSRRFHHASILCRADSDIRGAADLAGRRVVARSWPQTSGVWVRGILMHDHGLRLEEVTWIVQEGPHVEHTPDPAFVQLDTSGRPLLQLLADGTVDAVTGLHGIPAGTRPVLPDAAAQSAAWFRRTGIFPINHVVALRRDLVLRHPWLPAEVMRLFARAGERPEAGIEPMGGQPDLDPAWPIGFAPNRAPMQMLLDFAAEQGLLPRRMEAEELFDPELTGAGLATG